MMRSLQASSSPVAFLVRGRLRDGARFEVGTAVFESRALLPTIDTRIAASSAGLAMTWHLLTSKDAEGLHPWDACHALVQHGLGVADTEQDSLFAEPDIQQQWLVADGDESGYPPPLPETMWTRETRTRNFARTPPTMGRASALPTSIPVTTPITKRDPCVCTT